MSEPLLEAVGLHKAYAGGAGAIQVLRELELRLEPNEAVAIVGESGVGKSTLLHVLSGLSAPDRGRLRFRGRDVYGAGGPSLASYRNRDVGLVFQFHHLLPEFSALENVEMPLRLGRRLAGARERARSILVRLGLESRLTHPPGSLSGGEQQRVAIARAVVTEPALVLCDEPTGNLDPSTGRRVFELLRELQRERAFALLLATHNARLALACDRVLRLEDGALRRLRDVETSAYFDGLGA
jgi:lipoprotein-releasing system ATP-binding protein